MASMEDTSDCESVVGVFTLVKKVESKQKNLDYFKKGDILFLIIRTMMVLLIRYDIFKSNQGLLTLIIKLD
jgi:hypothetical protein